MPNWIEYIAYTAKSGLIIALMALGLKTYYTKN